jgi:hypothetical protein
MVVTINDQLMVVSYVLRPTKILSLFTSIRSLKTSNLVPYALPVIFVENIFS